MPNHLFPFGSAEVSLLFFHPRTKCPGYCKPAHDADGEARRLWNPLIFFLFCRALQEWNVWVMLGLFARLVIIYLQIFVQRTYPVEYKNAVCETKAITHTVECWTFLSEQDNWSAKSYKRHYRIHLSLQNIFLALVTHKLHIFMIVYAYDKQLSITF